LGDVAEYLSSRTLVVRDQPQGGSVFLVAKGRDGFARRDPSGRWTRIGFGVTVDPSFTLIEPPTAIPAVSPVTGGRARPIGLALAAIAVATVLAAGTVAARRRRGRSRPWWMLGLVGLAAALALCGPGTQNFGSSLYLWAMLTPQVMWLMAGWPSRGWGLTLRRGRLRARRRRRCGRRTSLLGRWSHRGPGGPPRRLATDVTMTPTECGPSTWG
jgi:hypothetical protein